MLLVLNMPGFWTNQGSEWARVLNIPRFWIRFWFWICQGSEYASGSEFAGVLNMSRLHRVLNMPKYAWLCLAEYVSICLNLLGYAWICLNCLNSLCVIFPHCNPLSTWRCGYLFQRFHKTRSFSLNENEAVFLEKHNLI